MKLSLEVSFWNIALIWFLKKILEFWPSNLGINRAYAELGITVPVVCRLEGTNVDSAKQILAESGNPIHPADSMQTAAKIAVELTPQ